MTTGLLIIAAAYFLWLGVLAMRRPRNLLRGFGITAPTADGQNEIRAIYGGFPLALAAVLLLPIVRPELLDGIVVTSAAAVLGMVAGRLVSAAVDRSFGRFSLIFTAVEVAIATILIVAQAAH
jgi:Domain of unknown function (DUF4345)